MKGADMNISHQIRWVAGLLAAIAVLIALAGIAQAAIARPAPMSIAEYRALMLRSQALNKIYHLGTYSRVRVGMTGAEYRALMLRSEALNKKYGLGHWKTPAAAPKLATVAGGLSWTAYGIGAAAVAGLVLLLAGAIAARRSGHRIPRTRISS
jgi:hypothetical protein